MKIYGIKNCETVKKALNALDAKGISYEFHDYKKLGVEATKIQEWLKKADLSVLVNKKGTTYKKLDDNAKAALENVKTAIPVMISNTSVIKRPILELNKSIIIGFDTALYDQVTSD
jgi:Spx/MgsR family transcriptional regulator